MEKTVFSGVNTKKIKYPLGGIGTGYIGLCGDGSLSGFEPCARYTTDYNRVSPFFFVKAQSQDGVVEAKALKAHNFGKKNQRNIYSKCKIPTFDKADFEYSFPFAQMEFSNKDFPAKISMTAFSPFIVTNDLDSSIPCAMFEFEIQNTGSQQLEYTVCLGISCLSDKSSMEFSRDSEGKIKLITLSPKKADIHPCNYTSFSIATNCEDFSYGQYLFSKNKTKSLEQFWDIFNGTSRFDNTLSKTNTKTCYYGGVLCAHVVLEPSQKTSLRFTISWYNPYSLNSWNPIPKLEGETENDYLDKNSWKNYYCNFYRNAEQSSIYCMRRWSNLVSDAQMFSRALYESTLPKELLQAIGTNLCFLKSAALMRNADGSVYGFDGENKCTKQGEGTNTGIYNYNYALAFLFPKLERALRLDDYKINQNIFGAQNQRMPAPKGVEPKEFLPTVEGQLGGVLRAYREFKICGSKEWLMELYNKITLALDYVFDKHNTFDWDKNQSGVLSGAQQTVHGGYLFGSSGHLNLMYAAALKAGAQMAEVVGDKKGRIKYNELYQNAKRYLEENLFNGSYYYQKIDLEDKTLLCNYPCDFEDYWLCDKKQIKNQIGEGCYIGQLEAQWHSTLIGLGEIADSQKTKIALKSIYNNNFLNKNKTKKKGVILCSYPKAVNKPAQPINNADKIAEGYEYAFASHLIMQGFCDEGVEVVKKICRRYDGKQNNPFDCNDAKNLSGYCLLNAASGFEFDMYKKYIGFKPVEKFAQKGTFICCFALNNAFGMVEKGPDYLEIKMLRGKLEVRYIGCPSKPLRCLYYGRVWDLKVVDGTVADMGNVYTVSPEKGIMIYL